MDWKSFRKSKQKEKISNFFIFLIKFIKYESIPFLMDVALGVVQKDKQFLLIERVKQTNGLRYAFPGGKKEGSDLNLEETVMREVLQETGIICKPYKYLGSNDVGINLHYFLCEYIAGDIKIQEEEVKQCHWYSPKEIYELVTTKLYPPVKEFLDTI